MGLSFRTWVPPVVVTDGAAESAVRGAGSCSGCCGAAPMFTVRACEVGERR